MYLVARRYRSADVWLGARVAQREVEYVGGDWRRGIVVSGVRHMNEVNPRRAQLVLGWVTVFGRVYHLGM